MDTWAFCLFIAGVALQLAGGVIGIVGLFETWRKFAAKGQRFMEKEIQAFEQARNALVKTLRKVSKRPTERKVHPTTAEGKSAPQGEAAVVVVPGPLPAAATDPLRFAAEVEERLNTLHRAVQDAASSIAAEAKTRQSTVDETHTSLKVAVAEVEALSRSIAVAGLRHQFAGWWLVTIGFLLQSASGFLVFVLSKA
jgi:DNA polymerase II large subunit